MDNTISEWLYNAKLKLSSASIETARLDVLVLLADELGVDKSYVLAHTDEVLQRSVLEKLHTKITQRARHTPLAYIRGKAEFYGREFVVNEHVLVPRPESEAMIELLKRQTTNDYRQTIIDIGTGSGCLALTVKLELPEAQVYAVDIDINCLQVAQKNAKKLGTDITFLHGDLLQPICDSRLWDRDSIVLANLPYVPDDYPINKAAHHEPSLALFSGQAGLAHYRTLFEQITRLKQKPLAFITESLLEQHDDLSNIAQHAGYTVRLVDGLAQLFTRTIRS